MEKQPKLSRNTTVFSAVSFLMDVSSEMIIPLLPFFLVNILFAPVAAIGLIEAVRELAARFASAIAGAYSDSSGRRKKTVIVGYSLSGLMKFFIATSTAWTQVLAVVFLERVGKGIREAPRDALMVQSEKKGNLGKAFGFRSAADNAGAILGPMIATVSLAILMPYGVESAYRSIFFMAVIPAIFAVALLFFVQEKKDGNGKKTSILKALFESMENPDYRKFAVAYSIFAIGNISITFFLLRSGEFMGIVFIPIVYMIYNVFSTLSSIPAGYLSDRIGPKKAMLFGQALFALCLAGFAFFPGMALIMALFAVAGVFAAINETAPKVIISKTVPKERYASAAGALNGLSGVAAFAGNAIAGILYTFEVFSSPATFAFAIVMVVVSMAMLWKTVKDQ